MFNDMITYRILRYVATLAWDKQMLSMATFQRYANTVEQVTGLQGIWGFVEETVRSFCRPGEDYGSFYSVYKKAHGFKFQSIVTPDGLQSSLVGPFPEPVGDWVV